MGIFTKKVNSDEYEKLRKKITENTGLIEELGVKFEQLKVNMNSLRGLVNRKIKPEDEDENIKYKDFLPI